MIDSLYGDSVQLVISPDTLYDVGLGDLYHLINIFPTAPAPAARIFVQKEQIKLGGVTTIKFDHIPVPQDFYVVFVGGIDQSSNTVIPVWIRGDAEPVRTLAPESTRSAMLATNGVNLITAIIDGQYILNGRTDAAFTNFYMNAFVSQGDGAVSTASSNSDGLAVYPNPSNHTLTVAANASTGAVRSIALIDALGRNAWSSTEFDAMARIDVSALPTGSYRLVVHDDSGIHTTPISIVH